MAEGGGLDVSIDIYIDIFDMEKTTKTLGKLRWDLDNAVDIGIEKAQVAVVKKLTDILTTYYGGKLANMVSEIEVVPFSDGFMVSVGGDHADYVEYGTGIVGSKYPHPDPDIDWEYDVNDWQEDGWIYNGADGKRHWTAGMPSRPYMYELTKWIKSYGIVARCIKKELRKIK